MQIYAPKQTALPHVLHCRPSDCARRSSGQPCGSPEPQIPFAAYHTGRYAPPGIWRCTSPTCILSARSCVTSSILPRYSRCKAKSSSSSLSLSCESKAENGSSNSKNIGVGSQRPGDGHPLLLPRRQLFRITPRQRVDIHDAEQMFYFSTHLRNRQMSDAIGYILIDRHMREQSIILENKSHLAFLRRQVDAGGGIEKHLAAQFYKSLRRVWSGRRYTATSWFYRIPKGPI